MLASFSLPCSWLIPSYISDHHIPLQKEACGPLFPISTLFLPQAPTSPQSHGVCQRVPAADPGPAAQCRGLPLRRPGPEGPSRRPGGHPSPGRWVSVWGATMGLPSTLLACRVRFWFPLRKARRIEVGRRCWVGRAEAKCYRESLCRKGPEFVVGEHQVP